MSVLGLIIARAGSRGVPGKNTMPIAGAPCVRWTIDAGLEALHRQAIDVLAVSTDDDGVASEAMARSLALVTRPPELVTAEARVDAVMRHALGVIEARLERSFDAVALLYANVPVRPPGLIERAAAVLRSTGCDSVQSYAPVGKHHPWWTARIDEQTNTAAPFVGTELNNGVHRRQDLPPAFVPDGGVLVVTAAALRSATDADAPHAFLGADRRGVLTAEGEVVDIDAPNDALLADAILSQRIAEQQGGAAHPENSRGYETPRAFRSVA
ncbi:MAG: acylneuraminate cytidylyltransferase family protein [Phycisphaerales bacterium]